MSTSTSTVELFRPVGLYELALILAADSRRYPPRLPEQPIFYPVLDRGYAEEIASRWNPPDPHSGFMGAVTRVTVPPQAIAAYPEQVVGDRHHRELWVPAGEQAALEDRFAGRIEVLAAWLGERVSEVLPGWEGGGGELPKGELPKLLAAIEQGPVFGGPLTQGPM